MFLGVLFFFCRLLLFLWGGGGKKLNLHPFDCLVTDVTTRVTRLGKLQQHKTDLNSTDPGVFDFPGVL